MCLPFGDAAIYFFPLQEWNTWKGFFPTDYFKKYDPERVAHAVYPCPYLLFSDVLLVIPLTQKKKGNSLVGQESMIIGKYHMDYGTIHPMTTFSIWHDLRKVHLEDLQRIQELSNGRNIEGVKIVII